MGTILDQIILQKKEEIIKLKEQPLLWANEMEAPSVSFIEKIKQASQISIIAEFKRASPSKGVINNQRNPKTQASDYILAGADAISVLTDSMFFQGSYNDLKAVRSVTSGPVLCKDFIIDPVQLDVAKASGASMVLLIAAVLDVAELKSLYRYAISLGLEVLMEIHNDEELKKVLHTDNVLIGVNNRDLKTFQVDLATTEKLSKQILKEGRHVISESGIQTVDDVKRLVDVGASGILVGESLMRDRDPQSALRRMKLPLKKVTTS